MFVLKINKSMTTTTALLMILCIWAIPSLPCAASSPPSTCPHQLAFFINALSSQSPISYSPTSPLQVRGNFLDNELGSKSVNAYTAVLFYASWCPFSHKAQLLYGILSSMFLQVEHIAVEESSVEPSILSRYGVHSFPTVLLIKQKSKLRFHGSKNLPSLVRFYKKTTGLEPIQYVATEQPISLGSSGEFVMQSWLGSSPSEILKREPYLIVCLLLLSLLGFINAFPKLLLLVKTMWVSYGPQLNMEIFGETSQIFGRVLQMIDLKRIWTKMKLCKTRNFLNCAKNARVWASSLASVSLGKTTSCRS